MINTHKHSVQHDVPRQQSDQPEMEMHCLNYVSKKREEEEERRRRTEKILFGLSVCLDDLPCLHYVTCLDYVSCLDYLSVWMTCHVCIM